MDYFDQAEEYPDLREGLHEDGHITQTSGPTKSSSAEAPGQRLLKWLTWGVIAVLLVYGLALTTAHVLARIVGIPRAQIILAHLYTGKYWWHPTDTFNREFTQALPVSDAAKTLPQMDGSGVLRSLREAATLSGALLEATGRYAGGQTFAQQEALVDDLLLAWADTGGMAANLQARAPMVALNGPNKPLSPAFVVTYSRDLHRRHGRGYDLRWSRQRHLPMDPG